MSVARWGLLCGLLSTLACAPASGEPPADPPSAGLGGAADGGASTPDAGLALDALQPRVVAALCDALSRCCDVESTARFFAPMRQSQRLPAELRARLPTDGGLSGEACTSLLAEVYDLVPLGSWVRAAQAGLVSFDAAGAEACLAALATARCGAEVGAALLDGTCFGFGPPAGGPEQRRAFLRTAAPGSTCVDLADGVGGSFFGTCEPNTSFCCGLRQDGSCGLVGASAGVCRPASLRAQACGLSPSLQACATGLECDPGTGTCVAPITTPLALGAPCVNGTTLLGDCVNGWCDFGATGTCQALGALDAGCRYGWQCETGECSNGLCAAARFCVGR